MKNLVILLGVVLSVQVWGQNNAKEIDTVIYSANQKTVVYTDGTQFIEMVKKPKSNSSTSQKKFKSLQSELEYLIKYVSDLEIKMDKVQNDPTEDEIAKKEGWYDKINGYIHQSKARIEEINKLLNSKEK